jgi:hypothetical protein
MSVIARGPAHQWFAWHPVDTADHGWKWLRKVWRQREYIDLDMGPIFREWRHTALEPNE